MSSGARHVPPTDPPVSHTAPPLRTQPLLFFIVPDCPHGRALCAALARSQAYLDASKGKASGDKAEGDGEKKFFGLF